MESKGKVKEILSVSDLACQTLGQQKTPRKPYQRLTAQQTQYLERIFDACSQPDEKQREELSNQLDLTPQQIKYWFQNRRTRMKVQEDRQDNCRLRQEQQMLRDQNLMLREAFKNVTCPTCSAKQMIRLRQEENQRLRQQGDLPSKRQPQKDSPLSTPDLRIEMS